MAAPASFVQASEIGSGQGLCRTPSSTGDGFQTPRTGEPRVGMCYWKQPPARKGGPEGKWRRAPAVAEPRDRCSALHGGGREAHFFFLPVATTKPRPEGHLLRAVGVAVPPADGTLSARADSTRNLSWACMGCSLFLAEEAFSLSPGVWSMLDALAQTSGCGKLGKPLQLMPWLRLDKGRIRHTDTRRLVVIHVAPAWPGLCLQKDAPTRNLVALHLTPR